MRIRTSAAELERDAFEALVASVAALGLEAAPDPRKSEGADLIVVVPGGGELRVEVKASSIPTADQAHALAEHPSRGHTPVLVADQIPASVRSVLNEASIGWLDRRGHLRLTGTGLYVDADVPPQSRKTSEARIARDPIKGRSGLAAAAALLLDPEHPLGVSETAQIAGLNPSSITRAFAALHESNLAERIGRGRYRPLVPELFWALADVWPRERTVVRWSTDAHAPDDGLAHPLADPGDASWVAAGVRGALEWGAPIVATSDLPVDLYLPTERDVRRVAARHAGGEGTEVRLAADPNGFVGRDARQAPGLAWPLALPLFCALDLTASARDREALDQWTPPEPFTRVW